MGPRQRAHFPAAGQKIRGSRSVDLQHLRTITGEPGPERTAELIRLSQFQQTRRQAFGSNIFREGGTKRRMPAQQPLPIAVKAAVDACGEIDAAAILTMLNEDGYFIRLVISSNLRPSAPG
jgi:hypothetical protein